MLKVDLRSDTVTLPTEKMRLAMASSAVGDDVYAEDPTVNLLEQTIAKACNMQAAVFTASGTMGNQTALMSYLSMGDELFVKKKPIYLILKSVVLPLYQEPKPEQ